MDDRREPVLMESSGDAALEHLSFMREAAASQRRAGPALWLSALAAFVLFAALNLRFLASGRASGAMVAGVALGSLFWPMVAVGVSCLWDQRRSQRTNLKVFTGACLVFSALLLLGATLGRGYWQRWLNKENMTAEEFRAQAGQCARLRDLACQEANWRDYNRLRPNDSVGIANLGMVLNLQDKHQEAVEQFKKAIALGEGAYDLFAFHADSLAKLGETGQAIEWSYRSLSASPNLVDVRGKLAKLLVGADRPFEAMALLQSYDSQREAHGLPAYFTAQRIAIETAVEQPAQTAAVERTRLRLPAFANHYFAPVTVGHAKPKAFLVDTGATWTTVNQALIRDAGVNYRVTQPDIRLTTADGRKVAAKAITIESMAVGRFQLNNVPAVMCADCALLLGQSTLSGFDLQSSRVGGVEFLTLTPRAR